MNGIRDRLQDANLLWEHGRRSGAFLCLLCAVDATAKKRYPKLKVGERFGQFLQGTKVSRIRVEYNGCLQELGDVFYLWLRNSLVHEADIPGDIEFMEEEHSGAMSVRAGGAPEYVLKLGVGWFHHLVAAVIEAPENKGLFE